MPFASGVAEQAKWGNVKFLGKLYIDRHRGKPLNEFLLQRAIKIIYDQAPKKNKMRILFSATEKTFHPQTQTPITACLVGADQSGDIVLKTAILNILSLGRFGHIVYYVTAGVETEQHSRYWVRAFSCRSSDHSKFICRHIIAVCSVVQNGWAPKRGTQLSLFSTASTGSQGTEQDEADARSAVSGLSANTGAPTSKGVRRAGPPASVSQHTMQNLPQTREQIQARAPLGNVGNRAATVSFVTPKKAAAPQLWEGGENGTQQGSKPVLTNRGTYLSIYGVDDMAAQGAAGTPPYRLAQRNQDYLAAEAPRVRQPLASSPYKASRAKVAQSMNLDDYLTQLEA